MTENRYFHLFDCCIPVKGVKRSTICDLQRDDHELIPNVLYTILTRHRNKTIEEIKRIYHFEYNEEIDSYFDFLVGKEYGIYTDDIQHFRKIENKYEDPRPLNNAIIDFDENSQHDFPDIVRQLSELHCWYLECRFYYAPGMERLRSLIKSGLADCSLRSVELLIGDDPADPLTEESLIELFLYCPRIKKITVHSACMDAYKEMDDTLMIFTKEKILSEQCCGVISPHYFISKTELFFESQHFNNCLNKKIAIDKAGNIKNCPSMTTSFGTLDTTDLAEVLARENFRRSWKIAKKEIEVCQSCEFRYICQDCRAYVTDVKNPLSKPLKCKYDPFEARWEE